MPTSPKELAPNVLLIVTDDQGYGDFECTGNPWLKTPALNQLHDDSVRLTQFHVDPMCAPTRAALMTGCHSARAGVWSTLTGRYFLNRTMPTMANGFRAAGYRTGMFGKWHLGDARGYLPHQRGFDHALHHHGGVIGEMPDHWDNDYFNATFQRNGNPERFTDTYCTDVWFDEAIAFIRDSIGRGVPFFCYLATNAPHSPYDVHDRYAEPYREQGVPADRANFFGMIANLDENVGRLRTELDTLGSADDTIVIYMGDNGTACGATVDAAGHVVDGFNAGLRGKKCWATDGGHRNLCMLHWPRGGWVGGRDVDRLTAHIDLLPTLANTCGFDTHHCDGHDLTPALQGKTDDTDDRVLVVHNQQRDNPVKYKDYAVLTRDWRLVQTNDWGPGRRELTATHADPGQRRNLIDQHPDVADRLLAMYEQWWKSVDQAFDQSWPFYLRRDDDVVTLTAHAWHGTTQPTGIYDQNHCRLGVVQNGYWLIDVLEPGRYAFELRRWPREADAAITAGLPARTDIPHVTDRPAGIAIAVRTATLTVTTDESGVVVFDRTVDVDPDAKQITHPCELGTGRHRVLTRLDDADGVERGAYYLYITPAQNTPAQTEESP
ncbi:MAG: arylsulfatase [Planctomycetota bacterium]